MKTHVVSKLALVLSLSSAAPVAFASPMSCQQLFASAPHTSSSLVHSTVRHAEQLPESKRVEAEEKYAHEQLRLDFLSKKKFLEKVRGTLKEEFTEFDDFIDELLTFDESVLLVSPGSPPKKRPALVVHLVGPAGVGKTSILFRHQELLGSLDRIAQHTFREGDFEFPVNELLRLSDQRHAHKAPGISMLVLDETGNFKPTAELSAVREVPVENDPAPPLDGRPRMRIVNEKQIREESLEILSAATGNGVFIRIPQKSPMEYADQLSELGAKMDRIEATLAQAKRRIEENDARMSTGKEIDKSAKDALVDAMKLANEQISEEESKKFALQKDVFRLLQNMKRDQPAFFNEETSRALARAMKFAAGQEMDLFRLSLIEVRDLWSKDRNAFAQTFTQRADQLPEKPVETFHNTIIAALGNNVEDINKVNRHFRGKNPTADEVVEAYATLVPDTAVEKFITDRWGEGPAIISRMRVRSAKLKKPLSHEGFVTLAKRQIELYQREYKNALEAMGIQGSRLQMDASVLELLMNDAVKPLLGPREFFPRAETILARVTKRTLAEVAELSLKGRVPSVVTFSFDPKTRKLLVRTDQPGESLVSADFEVPTFREAPPEPELSKFNRQVRSASLASTAVVGMVLLGSYPTKIDINTRKPGLYEYWNPPSGDAHGVKQRMISTLLGGFVGEQMFAPGVEVTELSKDQQEFALSVLTDAMMDLEYRQKNTPNISSAVRETQPDRRLPKSLADAFTRAEFAPNAEMLSSLTKTAYVILKKNKRLVRVLARHISEHGSLSPEEMKGYLETYTNHTFEGKSLMSVYESFKLSLDRSKDGVGKRFGPPVPSRMASTKKIKEEPGVIHLEPISLFKEQKAWDELRKFVWGVSDGHWQ